MASTGENDNLRRLFEADQNPADDHDPHPPLSDDKSAQSLWRMRRDLLIDAIDPSAREAALAARRQGTQKR